QMARDGFLIQEAYRGLRVADIEVDSMLEIARVRVALDTEAIDEILDDSTGARMARLEESWERFESESNAADPLAVHEAHIRFHRGIWEAAGNYLLMRIWPVVEAQMTIILAYDQFTRRDAERAHAIHAALMRAIRSGDRARIRTALDVHTTDSAQELALLVSGSSDQDRRSPRPGLTPPGADRRGVRTPVEPAAQSPSRRSEPNAPRRPCAPSLHGRSRVRSAPTRTDIT